MTSSNRPKRGSGFLSRLLLLRVYSRMRPIVAMQKIPNKMPISRMFSRMSPFKMWLNSWPMTPCSSSRDSLVMQLRVTATAASLGVWPAAKALMPSSSSST